MSRGRKAPPPSPIRISKDCVDILASRMYGLMLMEYRHDPGCPTIATQRIELCTCDPDVEMLSYRDLERAGRVR